jgi:hypothetical protein
MKSGRSEIRPSEEYMAREMENLQCVAEGAIFREISY